MKRVEAIKTFFKSIGELVEFNFDDSINISGHYLYMIYNGDDIAQIGKGSDDRLKKIMRRQIAKKHNKVFISSILEAIKGQANQYAMVNVNSKEEAGILEIKAHQLLGIQTNRDGATLIEGIVSRDIRGIHSELWEKMKSTPKYKNLSEKEKLMAEELYELVTFAHVKVKRSSGKIISSVQGDVLEGNILQNIGKNYLIHIFQKLTENYLRYCKHKLSDHEFNQILNSFNYRPVGREFEVNNWS